MQEIEQVNNIEPKEKVILDVTTTPLTMEELEWIATRTFDNYSYGGALSEEELDRRLKLEEILSGTLSIVKGIIASDTDFDSLPYEEKVTRAINLIYQNYGINEEQIETKKINMR